VKLKSYKVYFHGEFVGIVHAAMTEGEAVVWFANRNRAYNQSGLMAVEG
jgi:hypothetical protein